MWDEGVAPFLLELRLDPNEAPNCLNREFMRSICEVEDGGEGRYLGGLQ